MKHLQSQVKDFCSQNNLNAPVESRVLDLVSEVGEVAKEILKGTNYGQKSFTSRAEMASELGDTLFALITIANLLNIDLEDALAGVLQKYSARLAKGTTPGSENE